MVSLLRAIRLDASDKIIFEPAAEPGEGVVSGGFLFHGRPQDRLSRKEKVAFRSGFLGISSFGFSTLAVVAPASAAEFEAAVEALAASFVARLGAPDLEAARPAAREEIAFSAELCRGHDEGRLIALHREFDASGEIRERFRALRPRDESAFSDKLLAGHDRAFHFVETEEEGLDLFAAIRPEDSRS